ncbi:hypothetical protein GGD56_003965 [Rhizobium mongolense]|uniref:Uncharacterized protein n=2 Tax=Rhizobium mongolense TaxID=57676 RepID=A0ABR6IQF0_9HYPH|nr:hypothetical protein [Rhizobium mongolense]TVZ72756.1 hypothetical protein BCL32_0942 [Rhizobium mongolense USDA 1844]
MANFRSQLGLELPVQRADFTVGSPFPVAVARVFKESHVWSGLRGRTEATIE